MKDKRVGILMGGLSAEHEVSIASGEAIYAALVSRGYDATRVFVDRDVDRVLRQEPVPSGERPCVRGDREAVALMREWTARAQGA